MASAAVPAGNQPKFSLDRKSRVPFYQQVYEALRTGIESGCYAADTSLPAIQDLATQFAVPPSTIRRAFQKLVADGLVAGTTESGFDAVSRGGQKSKNSTVAALPGAVPARRIRRPRASVSAAPVIAPAVEAPLAALELRPVVPEQKALLKQPTPIIFNRVSVLDEIDLARMHTSGASRPFRPGLPESREFPLYIWEGIRAEILRDKTVEMLEFSGTFGFLPLREAIATRLRNARGVKCSTEQVIVSAGSQQALNLVINTMVSPGDPVGVEEPGHYSVKAAFMQAGATVQPILVDEDGLSVPDARRQRPPQMIYTTPANQFPLGAKLSLPRRLSLLEFARKTNTWIIEDDSDGDFSYSGRPLPSLQGADGQNRVIYLGTTGKTMFPSLEIGYVVVPLSLMEKFSKTKEIMGGHASIIDQATLARFLSDGHFERHIHRMNQIYYQRLQALEQSADAELGDFIDIEPASGGLHAVGWLKPGVDEEVVRSCAASAGIELPLLSSYGRTALVRPGVVFGFASYTEQKIRQMIRKLALALRTHERNRPQPQAAAARAGVFQRLFTR